MWFLRAVELPGGEWACRHGLAEFDTHAHLHDALSHLRVLADDFAPATLVIHHRDGLVERVPAA